MEFVLMWEAPQKKVVAVVACHPPYVLVSHWLGFKGATAEFSQNKSFLAMGGGHLLSHV